MRSSTTTTTTAAYSSQQNHHPFRFSTNQQQPQQEQQQYPHKAQPPSQPQLYNNNNNSNSNNNTPHPISQHEQYPFLLLHHHHHSSQSQQQQQQYYFNNNNNNNNRQHNMSHTTTFDSIATPNNAPQNQSSWSIYHTNINHDNNNNYNHQTAAAAAASSAYTHHSVVNDFYHCLRSQVEFYFSDANLSRDTFLLSLLHSRDHPGRVPVATIASFPKVREIYASAVAGYHVSSQLAGPADPVVLGQALYGSPYVQLSDDGHWFHPLRSIAHITNVQPLEGNAKLTLEPSSGPAGANRKGSSSVQTSESTSPTVSPTSFDTGELEAPSSTPTSASTGGKPPAASLILHNVDPAASAMDVLHALLVPNNDDVTAHIDTNAQGVWNVYFSSLKHAQTVMNACQGNAVKINGKPFDVTLQPQTTASSSSVPEIERTVSSPSYSTMANSQQRTTPTSATTASPTSPRQQSLAETPHRFRGQKSNMNSSMHHPVPIVSPYHHHPTYYSGHIPMGVPAMTSPATAATASAAPSVPGQMIQQGGAVGYQQQQHHHHHMHPPQHAVSTGPGISSHSAYLSYVPRHYHHMIGPADNIYHQTSAMNGGHYDQHFYIPHGTASGGRGDDDRLLKAPMAQIYVHQDSEMAALGRTASSSASQYDGAVSNSSLIGGSTSATTAASSDLYNCYNTHPSGKLNISNHGTKQQRATAAFHTVYKQQRRNWNSNKKKNAKAAQDQQQARSGATEQVEGSHSNKSDSSANMSSIPRGDTGKQRQKQRSTQGENRNGASGGNNTSRSGNRRGKNNNNKKSKNKNIKATSEVEAEAEATTLMNEEHFPALTSVTPKKRTTVGDDSTKVKPLVQQQHNEQTMAPYVAALLHSNSAGDGKNTTLVTTSREDGNRNEALDQNNGSNAKGNDSKSSQQTILGSLTDGVDKIEVSLKSVEV